MPRHITNSTRVAAVGKPPKTIDEFIGRVNTGTTSLSMARMTSPSGWSEPGQRPEFDEFTLVLEGALHVETEAGEVLVVAAGEAIHTRAGEWVRYSTPGPDGARYIAICTPAFSPDTVHRDISETRSP